MTKVSTTKTTAVWKRIEKKVSRSSRNVFLTREFVDLARDDRQVRRALSRLVSANKLVRIGHGVYARAIPSPFDGRIEPVQSITLLGREALKQLGVKLALTRVENDLANGISTQVPTGRVVGVKKRVRRKLSWGGVTLRYERV